MYLSPAYQPHIAALWYLLPLAIMAALIKSPWFKGKFGEFLVNLSAQWFLDKSRYHLVKNVTLATEDGTTQIDHVLVSEFGVFFVETENMKGWIFGGPHQRFWPQKIYWLKGKSIESERVTHRMERRQGVWFYYSRGRW